MDECNESELENESNSIPLCVEDMLPDSPISVASMLIHAEHEYNNPEFMTKIFQSSRFE